MHIPNIDGIEFLCHGDFSTRVDEYRALSEFRRAHDRDQRRACLGGGIPRARARALLWPHPAVDAACALCARTPPSGDRKHIFAVQSVTVRVESSGRLTIKT